MSVNNSRIDYQHKELIDITNKLIQNSKAKVDSEIVGRILSQLLQYVKYHFNEEEELLKEHNYPKLDSHKEEHRRFMQKMAKFTLDVIDGKSSLTEEMINFLVGWLLIHTSVDDQDYKNYID